CARGSPPREGNMADGRRRDGAGVRAFWSGTITFGLVSIPVDLVAATRPRRFSLRLLASDGLPLRRRYFCPNEDRALDADEIVKGYQIEPDTFVVVTDEELAALEPVKSRDITLQRFVDVDEIAPLWFERAYFLAPSRAAGRAYSLM